MFGHMLIELITERGGEEADCALVRGIDDDATDGCITEARSEDGGMCHAYIASRCICPKCCEATVPACWRSSVQ